MYVGSSNGYAVPVYKTSDSTARTRVHCGNCPRCNEKLVTVFVHGHEQCCKCGSVIHDCCQGERA